MSRVFDALQQSELERTGQVVATAEPLLPAAVLQQVETTFGLVETAVVEPTITSASRLVSVTDDVSLGAEKYRVLATRLNLLQEQRPIKRVVVTSSSSREGKSVTVSNLALTLAKRMTKRVLLVEGDLRQPAISKLFGIGQRPGLSDWYGAQKPIEDYLVRISALPLWILPSGAPPGHPLDLLQSARMPEIMNQFMGWFDWILIDSPPVLPMADLALWSRLAEGVILVVRQGHTPKKFLAKAVEALDVSKLLGVVFNEGTEAHHRIYQSYYRALKGKREHQAESQD